MADEKATGDSKTTDQPTELHDQKKSPAVEALCSNAPDKQKCEEFVEKRLGEASDNIDTQS